MIKETRIISQKEVKIEGMSALVRQWSWGGIIAELVIFQNDDVLIILPPFAQLLVISLLQQEAL